MQKVAIGVYLALMCGMQGCYWFEEVILEIFPKENITKYYLHNIISAPDINDESKPTFRAEKDFNCFMNSWNHNIKEIVFDTSLDSVLFKELKVNHGKLDAIIVLHYRQLANLDDSSHPGFLLWKLDDEYPVSHNGTVVTINGTRFIQWPSDAEKLVIKFRTTSKREIRRRRSFIRLAPFYFESQRSMKAR